MKTIKYIIKQCPCGKEFKVTIIKSKRKKYCSKKCFYKYRKRPSGLLYKIKVRNRGWWRKNAVPWNVGKKCNYEGCHRWQKGERSSPETEFKYKNGSGYRHLLKRGILKQKCRNCQVVNLLRLHVHHIDGDRTNNAIDNLMVLCRKHHLPIHGRREKHYVEGRKIVWKS